MNMKMIHAFIFFKLDKNPPSDSNIPREIYYAVEEKFLVPSKQCIQRVNCGKTVHLNGKLRSELGIKYFFVFKY